MFYEIFLTLISIIGLVAGAELVIHRARHIAQQLNISSAFIGLTIFSIGASLPEIVTHIITSVDILRGGDIQALSGLSVGMNIGSNIIQITFITGIVTFFGVLTAQRSFLKKDFVMMIGTAAITLLFTLDSVISHLEGAILLLAYAAYLWYLFNHEQVSTKFTTNINTRKDRKQMYSDLITLIGGFIILLLSADRLAIMTEFFSEELGIAGSVLGALVVGIGTSLPELVTGVFAMQKREAGMSIGTLVGSNITNPLAGIGIGALISTYTVDPLIKWYDLPVFIGVTTSLLLYLWRSGRLRKRAGFVLAGIYVIFVILRLYVIPTML